MSKFDYTYNDLRQRNTAIQSGSAFADYGDSTLVDYGYNARGELTEARGYLGATVSAPSKLPGRQFQYGYDTAGNRTSANSTDDSGVRNDFTANDLNQYSTVENNYIPVSGFTPTTSTVVVDGRAAAAPRMGAFWADHWPDTSRSTPWSGTLEVYAKNGSSVYKETPSARIAAASQTHAYDDDGNMTGDGIWEYEYDAENRLVQMSKTLGGSQTITFKYDYLGRRVQKVVSSGTTAGTYRYVYDGWNLVAEYILSTASPFPPILLRSYTWGLDQGQSLSDVGAAGALIQIRDHLISKDYLPTYDGNGNVATLIDASDGSLDAIYEYSPFGELLRKDGTYAASNPFRFSTKFTDDETGLSYYGMRYYSASLGRFINRDPIEEMGGINLYGFAGNDGINGADILGMCSDDDNDSGDDGGFNFNFNFNFNFGGGGRGGGRGGPPPRPRPVDVASGNQPGRQGAAGAGEENVGQPIPVITRIKEFIVNSQAGTWSGTAKGLVSIAQGVKKTVVDDLPGFQLLKLIAPESMVVQVAREMDVQADIMREEIGKNVVDVMGADGETSYVYAGYDAAGQVLTMILVGEVIPMGSGPRAPVPRAVPKVEPPPLPVGAGEKTAGHHTIPRAVQKEFPPSVRTHPDVRGRPGNPNIKDIPESTHKQIHSSPPGDYYPGGNYNRRFDELVRQNGGYDNMTPQQINQIRDQVVREFGL